MQLFRNRFIYLSLVSLLFVAQAFCSSSSDEQDEQQDVHASLEPFKSLSKNEIVSIMRKFKESSSNLEGKFEHLQTLTSDDDTSEKYMRIPAIRSRVRSTCFIEYGNRPANNSSCILDPDQRDGIIIYANFDNNDSFQKARKEGLEPPFSNGHVFSNDNQCIFFSITKSNKFSAIGIRVNPERTRVYNEFISRVIYVGSRPLGSIPKSPLPCAFVNASSISLKGYLKLVSECSALLKPKKPYSASQSGQLVWLAEDKVNLHYDLPWAPEIVIETPDISPDKFAYVSGDVH